MSIENLRFSASRQPVLRGPTLVGRRAECATLEQLLRDVRTGRSAALVLSGDRGIGKTTLLDHAVEQAGGYRIIRARGVESEAELPYAGLHLLCTALSDDLQTLPEQHREALEAAIGVTSRPHPDRFRVGVAILTLLAQIAAVQPLLCVLDDAHWLDCASTQVLAFVARRLAGQPIALLLARHEAQRLGDLDGQPELVLGGLPDVDARELLAALMPGRIDQAVVERITAETQGNPAALLELFRGLAPADLAGGFGVKAAGRRADGPLDRVRNLPPDSRRILLAAAAEPLGDPTLLWRAAAHLGIAHEAAESLEAAGLLTLGPRVAFCRSSLRSAIYRAASKEERRRVHGALAAATNAASDRDRHAWHLAHAAGGQDDEAAAELERCADSALARGGLAAAAAFLEKAALLTLDPNIRAERALSAAVAKHQAGARSAAVRLLVTVEMGQLDESRCRRAQRLRAQIAFASRRGDDAAELLLQAARELEPLDPSLARETYLEAVVASMFAGRLGRGHGDIAAVARAGVPAPEAPGAIDRLLDGLLARLTDGSGHPAALLRAALGDIDAGRWFWLSAAAAADLWDDASWHSLTDRAIEHAREAGALTLLPYALTGRAILDLHCGDLAAATALVEEAEAVAAAIGDPPFAHSLLMLAAWQGQEGTAAGLFDTARQDARERGEGVVLTVASYAAAVLYNGLGRYAEALAAAADASTFDELGLSGWALAEQVEAAVRSGDSDAAASALDRLCERTRGSGTEWALGIEARSRALLCDGKAAEALYTEAIDRLGRTRVRVHLARAQLVYGEWLRRQGRRMDARSQLRAAHTFFAAMGAEAFAERAHRELLATGEKARRRSEDTRGELTPQELRVALLARDGQTNPEIGARLFVSPRTVEYHLHKVFDKLGIGSRTELHLVLTDSVVGLADGASHKIRQPRAAMPGTLTAVPAYP